MTLLYDRAAILTFELAHNLKQFFGFIVSPVQYDVRWI